mmetsp:Transcript_121994/g.345769  ORF Transcript_121994/g.345769 Transcript_121994/m.345769 type:complete len:230 (-) Transcript_121994:315-1004(-)
MQGQLHVEGEGLEGHLRGGAAVCEEPPGGRPRQAAHRRGRAAPPVDSTAGRDTAVGRPRREHRQRADGLRAGLAVPPRLPLHHGLVADGRGARQGARGVHRDGHGPDRLDQARGVQAGAGEEVPGDGRRGAEDLRVGRHQPRRGDPLLRVPRRHGVLEDRHPRRPPAAELPPVRHRQQRLHNGRQPARDPGRDVRQGRGGQGDEGGRHGRRRQDRLRRVDSLPPRQRRR